MLSHADFFSSLHVESEIVHYLLGNCKNVLERGCEHNET